MNEEKQYHKINVFEVDLNNYKKEMSVEELKELKLIRATVLAEIPQETQQSAAQGDNELSEKLYAKLEEINDILRTFGS